MGEPLGLTLRITMDRHPALSAIGLHDHLARREVRPRTHAPGPASLASPGR